MYSFKTKKSDTKRAKGIKKNVVKQNLTHESYKDVLLNSKREHIFMKTIRSQNHEITSCFQNKIGLSCYDDKRYILSGGCNTLAYGHYMI